MSHLTKFTLSYETSLLKPAPSCPNINSSYKVGFTSVAIGTTELSDEAACNRSCRQSVDGSADTDDIYLQIRKIKKKKQKLHKT